MATLTDFFEAQDRNRASIVAGLCGCWRCMETRKEQRACIILCPECGNKRCPRASDHDLSCSGSNDPGQPGSVY